MSAVDQSGSAAPARRPRARLALPPIERRRLAPALVAALVVVFVLITVWWQRADDSFPVGDYGKHLLIAIDYYDLIHAGHLAAPFEEYNLYPPLTHQVGAY